MRSLLLVLFATISAFILGLVVFRSWFSTAINNDRTETTSQATKPPEGLDKKTELRSSGIEDDPNSVVARAVKAMGGEGKLSKIEGFKYTLKVRGGDVTAVSDVLIKLPDRMKSNTTITLPAITTKTLAVITDKECWAIVDGNDLVLEGPLLDGGREDLYVIRVEFLFPLLHDKTFILKALKKKQVNGKAALGVKVTQKGHSDLDLYFDRDTGLHVSTVRHRPNPEGGDPLQAELIYTDRKNFGGIIKAVKFHLVIAGNPEMEAEITNVEYLEKVSAKEFVKP